MKYLLKGWIVTSCRRWAHYVKHQAEGFQDSPPTFERWQHIAAQLHLSQEQRKCLVELRRAYL